MDRDGKKPELKILPGQNEFAKVAELQAWLASKGYSIPATIPLKTAFVLLEDNFSGIIKPGVPDHRKYKAIAHPWVFLESSETYSPGYVRTTSPVRKKFDTPEANEAPMRLAHPPHMKHGNNKCILDQVAVIDFSPRWRKTPNALRSDAPMLARRLKEMEGQGWSEKMRQISWKRKPCMHESVDIRLQILTCARAWK